MKYDKIHCYKTFNFCLDDMLGTVIIFDTEVTDAIYCTSNQGLPIFTVRR